MLVRRNPVTADIAEATYGKEGLLFPAGIELRYLKCWRKSVPTLEPPLFIEKLDVCHSSIASKLVRARARLTDVPTRAHSATPNPT